jgi:hydroxymethylbilane synthase
LKKVRIICRSSRLSLLQAELVKQKILSVQPATEVEIIGRTSRGDRELHVNLSVLDGTDFFTEEIFDALLKNEADIAVHSLKDMSAQHFFSHHAFAVIDRDDARDVAIFNPDILKKIKGGEAIIVGTCSPRREEMAVEFLKKALPQLHAEMKIETRSIRGNVEGRLKQLNEGKYDATILATAGLNRLLRNETNPATVVNPDNGLISELLKDKLLMLLPLIECVPAPCQGAIVAEAHPSNEEAVALLQKINHAELFVDAYNEKKEAYQYGTGCLQKFGVTTLHTSHIKTLYAAGENNQGEKFSNWSSLPHINLSDLNIFSSTDFMKEFFQYEWSNQLISIEQPFVFVANYKAVLHQSAKDVLQGKKIFASGTRTWYELAKQGYWVNGCADALGFESFLPVLQMPLFQIQQNSICILTHTEAAGRWNGKGYHAVSNYKLNALENKLIVEKISVADFIFWSSFSQYKSYSKYSKVTTIHACAGGETATLLIQQGIEPIIFPTIKSFDEWRKSSIRQLSVA